MIWPSSLAAQMSSQSQEAHQIEAPAGPPGRASPKLPVLRDLLLIYLAANAMLHQCVVAAATILLTHIFL